MAAQRVTIKGRDIKIGDVYLQGSDLYPVLGITYPQGDRHGLVLHLGRGGQQPIRKNEDVTVERNVR